MRKELRNKSGVDFTLYLIFDFRNNDVEMHQDRQEGADACLGLFVILYRQRNLFNRLSHFTHNNILSLSLTQFVISL